MHTYEDISQELDQSLHTLSEVERKHTDRNQFSELLCNIGLRLELACTNIIFIDVSVNVISLNKRMYRLYIKILLQKLRWNEPLV